MQILIADQFDSIRKGIKRLLMEEFPSARIEEAANLAELENKIGANGWSLLIADQAVMTHGKDVLRELRKRFPALPILAMGMHSDAYYAKKMMKAGASDYLSKDAMPDHLVNTVNRVLRS